ncbi:MAG: Hsp20/alpha crystallin family protein [Candidatus Caldarchaeum sp.]|nr:Hsp20/alpha crystallin family protein [Candidatus Caldarchaeum sp.]MDW8360529.1 Hsp20/alpha crystallin family protein [Candidatus Caldarchaeum sp.]
MSDSRWDEFIRRMAREVEDRVREALETSASMFEGPSREYRTPRADFVVSGSNIYIAVEMPGCDKQTVEVNVDNYTVSVSGLYASPIHPEFINLYPFKHGKGYRRTIPLPVGIDTKGVEARYEAGVLMIKASVAIPRGVKVKVD